MAETVASLMERIDNAEQPVTNLVNARMQRIEELERLRQEHMAARAAGNNGDAASRHARRDQIIRQTARQQRSTERRSFASNIQRTPVRSMSYENTNTAANASTEQETSIFREVFDSSRQNLFGARVSGSTENLSSASFYGRRPSDTPLSVPRATFQTGSDSGSGSSTPRTSLRPQIDLSSGLAEAFAARASRVGSDARLTAREPRSMSVTRETRDSTRSTISSTEGNVLTRTASLRQNRMRDSRFRRRTIQGVDSSISQAIEQNESSQELTRSTSPLVTATTSGTSKEENVASRSVTKGHELTHSASFSTFSSRSDSYTSYKRIVELYPEDVLPCLGLEGEKVIFIDNSGRCHWLNRHHQIVMSCRAKTPLPEIVIKSTNKPAQNSCNDCDGYVAEMEDDADSRYLKLKQLITCVKLKDGALEEGDMTDSLKDLSLFEMHKRGDFLEKQDDDIDEMYQTVSLYTPPREKPDMDAYLASKEVVPLYDGIPTDQLPPEIKAQMKSEEPAKETDRESAGHINQYAVARMSGMTQSNSVTSRYESGRQAASQQRFYSSANEDGSSTSGYSRSDVDQSYSNIYGNGSSRQYASESRSQQSSVLMNDSVSSILRQRAEARRQQFLSESQNGNVAQRAETRRQQYLSESQTSRNGNTLVQSTSESNLEQFRSETRSSDGQSQLRTSQQQATSAYRQISTTEIQSPMITDRSDKTSDVNLVMERLFLTQGGDGPIDTSHLDYEEMRMIQKALEENPSPPPSPLPHDDYEYNESDFTTVQSDTNPITNSQFFMASSGDKGLDSISETSEGPFGSRRSESEASVGTVDSFIDNVLLNESTNAKTENNPVCTSSETVHRSGLTSSASTSESTNLVVASRPSSLSSSFVSSVSDTNTFVTARESVLTHTRSLDESVLEPRLPRYQRLPADSGDAKLSLPSMDWSPLEKVKSPLSPNRFSFEEKRPEKETASASKSTSSSPAKSTISKISMTPSSVNRPIQSELTIEIPDDVSKTNKSPVGRSGSSKSETESTKSSASPLVKSRNASRSGSEAPSPAGSETVTTVFEEFVQTIPRDLIEQWNKNNYEDT